MQLSPHVDSHFPHTGDASTFQALTTKVSPVPKGRSGHTRHNCHETAEVSHLSGHCEENWTNLCKRTTSEGQAEDIDKSLFDSVLDCTHTTPCRCFNRGKLIFMADFNTVLQTHYYCAIVMLPLRLSQAVLHLILANNSKNRKRHYVSARLDSGRHSYRRFDRGKLLFYVELLSMSRYFFLYSTYAKISRLVTC